MIGQRFILLDLHPEPETEFANQAEWAPDSSHDPADALPEKDNNGSFAGSVAKALLEVCNPVECLIEDPRLGLLALVFIGVMTVAVFMLGEVSSAVQEALAGGGPLQGLGLK